MQKFIYNGPPCVLGRHGKVETGAEVELRIHEALTVAGNPDFTAVDSGLLENPVQLCGTEVFDLRGIDWDSPRLMQTLNERRTLYPRMVLAMREIGIPLEGVNQHTTQEDILDCMVTEAVRNGWTLLDDNARRACPALPDAPPQAEPEPDSPEAIQARIDAGLIEEVTTEGADAPEAASAEPEAAAEAPAETQAPADTAPAQNKGGSHHKGGNKQPKR